MRRDRNDTCPPDRTVGHVAIGASVVPSCRRDIKVATATNIRRMSTVARTATGRAGCKACELADEAGVVPSWRRQPGEEPP